MRTGRSLAIEENERSKVAGVSSVFRDAFTAEANNLAIDDAPLLTQGSSAAYQDNGRAIDWSTPLHVKTTTEVLGNHAALDEPALV